MKELRQTRRALYGGARLLGDVIALLTFRPGRIIARLLNKFIGRTIVRRLWR